MPKINHIKFTVNINSGNQDIVDNHEECIRCCLNDIYLHLSKGEECGFCKDANGNTVGIWAIDKSYSEVEE